MSKIVQCNSKPIYKYYITLINWLYVRIIYFIFCYHYVQNAVRSVWRAWPNQPRFILIGHHVWWWVARKLWSWQKCVCIWRCFFYPWFSSLLSNYDFQKINQSKMLSQRITFLIVKIYDPDWKKKTAIRLTAVRLIQFSFTFFLIH